MAQIIKITSATDERVAPFTSLTDKQLRSQENQIIVESPKVILTALRAGLTPQAILCEERHITGDAQNIINESPSHIPLYTGSRDTLATITGYTLTRGVLCAMTRPQPPALHQILSSAHKILMLHGVCDTTNIGTIFRSAAALGIDAVLLSSDSCDPYNRRSIRTSMGSVFLVPWTWIPPGTEAIQILARHGFATAAMALRPDASPITSLTLQNLSRIAIIVGTEGDGLPDNIISASTHRIIIPMCHGVDSLNVATAAAIAMWELTKPGQPSPSRK